MKTEGTLVLVEEVRRAAQRIARNCKLARPPEAPCPTDCPGLTACVLSGKQ